jgi:hypothetical protein
MPPKLVLHAVVVEKQNMKKTEANKLAKKIINDPNKTFVRTTDTQWRYRNVPKTKFINDSYKTKTISKGVNLVFGLLK